jgi:hypothetical protein
MADTDDSAQAAIQDALDRAQATGNLNQGHIEAVADALRSAHADAEPEISMSARRGLGRQLAIDEAPDQRAPYDFHEGAERPATADEHGEMAAYTRWLANREPTGSAAAKRYGGLADRLSALAKNPGGPNPVMVPDKPAPPQYAEGMLFKETPEGVQFKPWEAIKGFMSSEPGSEENIKHATAIAEMVAAGSVARGAAGRLAGGRAGGRAGAAAEGAGEAGEAGQPGPWEQGFDLGRWRDLNPTEQERAANVAAYRARQAKGSERIEEARQESEAENPSPGISLKQFKRVLNTPAGLAAGAMVAAQPLIRAYQRFDLDRLAKGEEAKDQALRERTKQTAAAQDRIAELEEMQRRDYDRFTNAGLDKELAQLLRQRDVR